MVGYVAATLASRGAMRIARRAAVASAEHAGAAGAAAESAIRAHGARQRRRVHTNPFARLEGLAEEGAEAAAMADRTRRLLRAWVGARYCRAAYPWGASSPEPAGGATEQTAPCGARASRLAYEDLYRDPQREAAAVFAHLGEARCAVSAQTTTRKIGGASFRESVRNWAELCAALDRAGLRTAVWFATCAGDRW